MPFYLARYVGTGGDEDPFRPEGTDGLSDWSSIDLRRSPLAAVGWCLLRTSAPIAESAGIHRLGAGVDDDLPPTVRQRIESRLGLSLTQSQLRLVVRELLLSGREDGTRWRPLRPGRDGKYRIHLGGLIDGWAAIRGGAVIADDFNRADADALGSSSEGWSWTEVTGDIDIVTNAARGQDGSISFRRSARAETDLASDDHYAQAVCSTTNNSNSFAGVAVRFSSLANTFYGFYKRHNGASDLTRTVAGATTVLATGVDIIANGSVVRLEVNGSDLEAFDDGVSYVTATDTVITGNTRTGLYYGSSGGASRAVMDDFAAGDLGGGANVTGTAESAFGALTATASGTPTTFGTVSQTFGGLTATAVGDVEHQGTAATNFGALAATAAGKRTISGAAASLFGTLSAAATGERTVNGAAAQVLGGLAAASVGVRTVNGAAEASFGALTASAFVASEDGDTAGVTIVGNRTVYRTTKALTHRL